MNIYLTGPDGSGKTLLLNLINNEFIKKGIDSSTIWLRSPKILSKPILAYCRLIGLTKYKIIDGLRYGGHFFYKSKLISWIYPIIQLIDFKIAWHKKRKRYAEVNHFLFDRFSLDTLADLMVDTHRYDLHKTWIGNAFIKFIPPNTKVFLINTDEDLIKIRKQDTRFDPNLSLKIEVYRILSKDLCLEVIDNNSSINMAFKTIKEKIFAE